MGVRHGRLHNGTGKSNYPVDCALKSLPAQRNAPHTHGIAAKAALDPALGLY